MHPPRHAGFHLIPSRPESAPRKDLRCGPESGKTRRTPDSDSGRLGAAPSSWLRLKTAGGRPGSRLRSARPCPRANALKPPRAAHKRPPVTCVPPGLRIPRLRNYAVSASVTSLRFMITLDNRPKLARFPASLDGQLHIREPNEIVTYLT